MYEISSILVHKMVYLQWASGGILSCILVWIKVPNLHPIRQHETTIGMDPEPVNSV